MTPRCRAVMLAVLLVTGASGPVRAEEHSPKPAAPVQQLFALVQALESSDMSNFDRVTMLFRSEFFSLSNNGLLLTNAVMPNLVNEYVSLNSPGFYDTNRCLALSGEDEDKDLCRHSDHVVITFQEGQKARIGEVAIKFTALARFFCATKNDVSRYYPGAAGLITGAVKTSSEARPSLSRTGVGTHAFRAVLGGRVIGGRKILLGTFSSEDAHACLQDLTILQEPSPEHHAEPLRFTAPRGHATAPDVP